MPLQPPALDVRVLADVLAELQQQAQVDLPQWNQSPPSDAGVLLQRVFARLMEIALQRLNRVPEKNLLAFLDAMGIGLLSPSSAQAPLTFSLLQGSPPTVVPKGSQAATVPSRQAPAVVFETSEDFTVIPAQLARAFTMDSNWDRYADQTAAVAGHGAAAFTPFVGIERMPHILYVGHGALLDFSVPITATLTFRWQKAGIVPEAVCAFWTSLAYQYQSQGQVAEAPATAILLTDGSNSLRVEVELSQLIDIITVEGVGLPAAIQNRWLQIVLTAPFPDALVAHGLQISQIALGTASNNSFLPELAFNDKEPLDLTKEFYPFGLVPIVGSSFYIGSREALSKPNCTVTLHVDVTEPDPPALIWEYLDGNNPVQLSTTSIADLTNAFTTGGTQTISLVLPVGAVKVTGLLFEQVTGVFIRSRLLSGTYRGYPSITGLNVADTANLTDATAPRATIIDVKESNFAALGQVVQVASDYAVVTNIDANSRLTITPPLPNAHSVGVPVQLKLTAQVATLTAEFTPPATPATNATLSVNISAPFVVGSVLLIDDPGNDDSVNYEFVIVQSIDGAAQARITVTPSPMIGHGVGIALAVVGNMSLPVVSSNDRFLGTGQITAANPFPPFGQSPGPANFFKLYMLLTPDGPTIRAVAAAGPPAVAAAPAPAATVAPAPVAVVAPAAAAPGPSLFGRQVQLRYSFTVQQTPIPVDIAWEYLAAGRWVRVLPTEDNTADFINAGPGTIKLMIGPVTAGEVNGLQNYWIRARINSGNYGTPLQYAQVDPSNSSLGFGILQGSGNLMPPVLRSLTLDYSANDSPENVLTQNGFLYDAEIPVSGFFTPFVGVTNLVPFVQADPEPAFYLGFDAAFPEQPVTLYIDAAPRAFSGRVMRETSVAPSLLDQLPALRWEYFNGVAWHPLTLIDGTNNLTESGELNFETPLDIAPLAKFDSAPRYWIRVRSSGNDPLGTQQLDGVFLNTTTALQAVTVTGEILGSSSGQSGQTFRFARTPVLPGQQVVVREPEPPSDAEAAELLTEEGADAIQQVSNPTTGATEIWVRWHEVANFLFSLPYSRHYTLDHIAGTLTFGALSPPIGSQNIVGNYQSGGGAGGNLPAGAIAQVRSTLPAVASVANPTRADGGADAETTAMVEDRGPQEIKHRGQAVAPADIEWLALEAAGTRVARAKCIPNVNQDLVFEPGWVTLLIVPNGTDAKPAPDSQLIREVESYLASRAFVGLKQQTPTRINVIGPGYIKVVVAAQVVATDLAQTEIVKERLLSALSAYFHPLVGGPLGAGWPFGQLVYVSKVAQLIENTAGVDHVEGLQLIPNMAQHRLIFDASNKAADYLAQATTVASQDRSKSALLADTVDLNAGRALVKGFKEGDEITKVIDVTVQSISGTTVQISGFKDTTGMPKGSIVMTFDGLERTRLALGVLPGQTVSSIVLESALDVSAGDVLTLLYPFRMTISTVTLEAIELTVIRTSGNVISVASFGSDVSVPAGTLVATVYATNVTSLAQGIGAGASGLTQIAVADQNFASSISPGDAILLLTPSLRLVIEIYDPELPFDAGSVISTLDNTVRLPLLQGVAAGQPLTAIRLNDFAVGDLLAPNPAAPALAVAAVEPAYDIVAMDDNFLIYSGTHQIAMVEA
jgi:hypothetical protein